jgi:prepilin peptidase CpaA
MSESALIPLFAMATSVTACVWDLRTRRIPNALTFSAALLGLLVQLFVAGPGGALTAVGGWAVGLLLFLPFFMLGGMGGGDVKLLAALGAFLGPRDIVWLAVYSSIAGGVLAVIVAGIKGYLVTAVRNVAAMVGYWRIVGFQPVPNFTLDSAARPGLAYAVPILAGTVITLWVA